jgi:transposase
VLGEVATAAAKTDTFLGARYRRLVRRRGEQRALVAVARSILVIVWHLLDDPDARYVDLGSDYYTRRLDHDRKTRDLVRQLQALGHEVTLESAASTSPRGSRPEQGSAPHPKDFTRNTTRQPPFIFR